MDCGDSGSRRVWETIRVTSSHHRIPLSTILNRVEPFKYFSYGKAKWAEDSGRPKLEVESCVHKNGRAICSGCGPLRPSYHRLPEQRFEVVPMWGIWVYFVYALRRGDCSICRVTAEQVPRARGKCHLTTSCRRFLAWWAKRLSRAEVAYVFHTNWMRSVFESVKRAACWGILDRDPMGSRPSEWMISSGSELITALTFRPLPRLEGSSEAMRTGATAYPISERNSRRCCTTAASSRIT
jgi:hypothetical protein